MRFVYFKNANYTDLVENEVNMLIDKTVKDNTKKEVEDIQHAIKSFRRWFSHR